MLYMDFHQVPVKTVRHLAGLESYRSTMRFWENWAINKFDKINLVSPHNVEMLNVKPNFPESKYLKYKNFLRVFQNR